MNEKEILTIAAKYLIDENWRFVFPGTVHKNDGMIAEVTFLVPEALNPNIIIDPPDVLVEVDINTRTARIVPQM